MASCRTGTITFFLVCLLLAVDVLSMVVGGLRTGPTPVAGFENICVHIVISSWKMVPSVAAVSQPRDLLGLRPTLRCEEVCCVLDLIPVKFPPPVDGIPAARRLHRAERSQTW